MTAIASSSLLHSVDIAPKSARIPSEFGNGAVLYFVGEHQQGIQCRAMSPFWNGPRRCNRLKSIYSICHCSPSEVEGEKADALPEVRRPTDYRK